MKKLKQQYQLISLNGVECSIGLGAYGSVQLARCIKSNKTVAVKKIWNKLGITQVKFHQELNHENIIKLIDYFYDNETTTMYIVLEYAENGCLYDVIKRNGIEDKQLIKTIFKSVCYGLEYMHHNGIMHRDIKPQNILLGQNNIVKLCDFGFATYCEPRKTICGTPEYMAPEMIVEKHYNHKVDIWGLGYAPFEGNTKQIIIQEMKKPIYFSYKFTIQEIDLIHSILRVNPNQRPEITTILQHKWIHQNHIATSPKNN